MTDRYDAEAKAPAGCAPRRDPTQAAWDEWAQTVAAALSRAREAALHDAAWYLEERAAAHDRRGRVGRGSAGLLRREAAKVRALAAGEDKGRG